jgi:hypothetical protein
MFSLSPHLCFSKAEISNTQGYIASVMFKRISFIVSCRSRSNVERVFIAVNVLDSVAHLLIEAS